MKIDGDVGWKFTRHVLGEPSKVFRFLFGTLLGLGN